MPEESRELPCDLLVFDLDGTLIDSQQDLANSVNATLAHLHRPALDNAQIAAFIGDGASMLVQRAFEASGGMEEGMMGQAMPFFLAYYREHKLDFTHVYPGALAELQSIRTAAPTLPMAILTNKPVRPSRAICEGLGLSEFFFANYGGDSFAEKKPNPMGMHRLMQEAFLMAGSEIAPQRTVLVGDSHVDVETARAAGTLCLGCTYGLDTPRLVAAGPDVIVDHPSGWLHALRTMLA